MRFPDAVRIERPVAEDEYDDPGQDFSAATSTSTVGFAVTAEKVLLPPETEIAPGDRLHARGRVFRVLSTKEVRSTSKTVLWSAEVEVLR